MAERHEDDTAVARDRRSQARGPRRDDEADDLDRHRERARRHQAARNDPRRVKRRPDSGTGDRSTATARSHAD